MLVSDIMEPGGRVLMKSEFGPIRDNWPCLSFTKPSVGRWLQAEFRPGRDILLYVGTTNPGMTKNPEHRSRIISAVSIEPKHVLKTKGLSRPGNGQRPSRSLETRHGLTPWPSSTRR